MGAEKRSSATLDEGLELCWMDEEFPALSNLRLRIGLIFSA